MGSGAYKRCIFFLADGARAELLLELLRAGDLPNISKYMTDAGTAAEAATVFPSTTGPAYLPFLTGRFPGPCNMPGIRWFDRTQFDVASPFSMKRSRSYCGLPGYLINYDLAAHVPTVFELTQKPFNMHNPITRGIPASRNRFRLWIDHVIAHYTADHRPIHRRMMRTLGKVVLEDFDFFFISLPGPDHMGHYRHLKSSMTRDAYIEVDQAVGVVASRLEKVGALEDTLLFLSADHGMTETHTHFDLDGWLDRRGFKAYYHPRVFRHWTSANAASMVSGNSMSHLYFKSADTWAPRTPFEELDGGSFGPLLDDLFENESIDLVAGLGVDGAVRAKTRRGTGRIVRKTDGSFAYKVESGEDPFGYETLPQTFSGREALDLTFDSEYPDAIMQLAQIFDSPRTGDLVVCATDGHDLRMHNEHPEHLGSHGALTRHQMRVPFFSNHRLPADTAFRTVDFFPTAFNLLGWKMPSELDGIDLSRAAVKEEAA